MRKYYQTTEEAIADMQGHSFYSVIDGILIIMWQDSDMLQDRSVFVLLRENEGLYWEKAEQIK